MYSINGSSSKLLHVFLLSGLLALSLAQTGHAEGVVDVATRPAVFTGHDRLKQCQVYWHKALVEAYEAVGHKDGKWDLAAKAFLQSEAEFEAANEVVEFYRPLDTPRPPGLVALGKVAVEAAGCDDPMVVFKLGEAYFAAGRPDLGYPLLQKSQAALAASKYPNHAVAMALLQMAKLSPDADEQSRAKADARARLLDACCERPVGDRRLLLVDSWGQLSSRAVQRTFIDALQNRADADPWVLQNLWGRYYDALGWDSRGKGFGGTVTEDGWKGFYDNLTLARDHFKAAWMVAPELPQPAADMIHVALGVGQRINEDPLEWFDRSLKAQVDFISAYEFMLNTTLPKWGGSYEQMQRLALACIARPRYDTLVPWQYVRIVQQIGKESRKQPWALLADETVYRDVVNVSEGYASKLGPVSGAYYKTCHAAAALAAGNLKESRTVLEEMAQAKVAPDSRAFEYFGAKDGTFTASEVYARTGSQAGAIEQARASVIAKQSADAAQLLKTARAQMAAGDPGAAYVDRLAADVNDDLKFAAGEWTSIQPDKSLGGWYIQDGKWSAGPEGVYGAGNTPAFGKTLTLGGPGNNRRVGNSFEMSVVIAPLPQAKHGAVGTAGVSFVSMESGRRGFVFVDFESNVLGLFGMSDDQKVWRADLHAGSELLVRCVKDEITAYVDGKQVGDPVPLPDRFKTDLEIGLGGFDGAPMRYSKIKLRKVAEK